MLLHCTSCNATVPATILRTELARYEEGHQLISFCACPRCSAVMLASQMEEPPEYAGGPETYGTPFRIYPPQAEELSREIPELMRDSLVEAQRCYEHACFVAAAIMCRRTLEALCLHFSVHTGNLAQSITALHKCGHIDDRLKEWADALRQDGNLAAHDPTAKFSKTDARELVDFTEALLEYAVVLTARFKAFQKRRAERDASGSGDGG
jgi:Domain of unknown function (DUF4145)